MSAHHPFRPDMPAARVVKQGTRRMPPASLRESLRAWLTLSDVSRERLAIVVGLWPLILVCGMLVGMLWAVGYDAAQP